MGTNTCRPVLPEVFTIARSAISCSSARSQKATFLPVAKPLLVELGLRPLRLLARIDVGVDVEHQEVGVVERGALESLRASWRNRCPAPAAVRLDVGAGVPDMKLEGAVLAQPEERRQVVRQDVAIAARPDARRRWASVSHELRQLLLPVLLIEALAVDALGHADHGERPVLEVRQHEARDALRGSG